MPYYLWRLVLSIVEWQDGPRAGVTEHKGQPYLYCSAYLYCPPELLQVNAECDYDIEKDIFLLWPIRIDEDFRLAVWNNFVYYNRILTTNDHQKFRETGEYADWLTTYEEQTRMVYAEFTFSPYAALLCRARFEHPGPGETGVIWTPWQPPA